MRGQQADIPSGKPRRAQSRADRLAREAQRLLDAAPTVALANDVGAGRQPYPAHLMPLSECGTLNADPKTMENYNPTGERGERRHTPHWNVAEEDRIDRMPPKRAAHVSKSWPSSGGVVVDVRGLARAARSLDETP